MCIRDRFKAAVAGAGISDWQSYYGENSIDQWMTPYFGASVYDDPAVYAKSSAINFIKQARTPTLLSLIHILASVASASLFYVVWLVVSIQLRETPGEDTGVQFKIALALTFLVFEGMGAAFVLMAFPWYFSVRWYDRLQRFGLIYFPLNGAATALIIGSCTSSPVSYTHLAQDYGIQPSLARRARVAPARWRSPSFRAIDFPACAGSSTARDRHRACD